MTWNRKTQNDSRIPRSRGGRLTHEATDAVAAVDEEGYRRPILHDVAPPAALSKNKIHREADQNKTRFVFEPVIRPAAVLTTFNPGLAGGNSPRHGALKMNTTTSSTI